MKSLREIEARSYLTLDDLVALEEAILESGFMTREKTLDEIERFTVTWGIDEYYFRTTPIEEMVKHLIATSASELVARYGGVGVGIELIHEEPDHAFYIVEESKIKEVENRIENNYPDCRVESYRTIAPTREERLRLYIVNKPEFAEIPASTEEPVFKDVCSQSFLEDREPETLARYQEAWTWMMNREAPYIAITEKEGTDETRVMVGIHGQGTRRFMAKFTSQMRAYDIFTTRKYKEPFLDDKTIYAFYFKKMNPEVTEDFSRELNTIVMLPEHSITDLFTSGTFSSQAAMYAISAAAFANQFITVLTEEYTSLSHSLQNQPEAKGILDKMKLRLVKDTFTEAAITQSVFTYPEIVTLVYQDFVNRLHPRKRADQARVDKHIAKINAAIETHVSSPTDRTIFQYFLIFNEMILKTNFFRRDKISAVYRLDPSFLNDIDFPEKPYGVFFCVGRPFVGFHIRFRDIARGGIRIVTSRNYSEYRKNLDTAFVENYNLALTQQKKNKDIPEGGSKGIILLRAGNQDEAERAFKDYTDSILDIINPHDDVYDRHGQEEILFFGPDEKTAGLMDWVPYYGRKQGYPFWRAFSTGKAPEHGGIPHDLYGMTTTSVHEYVLGVLEKMGLEESAVTKIQTGGPDGDLGSNEIKISRDKTIAVIDGSGVLYDPDGLNRDELAKLAKQREMVEKFDRSAISAQGFFVSINDKQITLPDGTLVPNGEEFRNTFHLGPYSRADLFVPCGGRPAAVNINNWHNLLDETGTPKFRLIVEGANLFITEEARLRLEESGVIVIKDASANKGGVTSSSLEVFSSLALSDEEFEDNFRVKKGVVPDFMHRYVQETIAIIKRNARQEFDLLWKEHQNSQLPFTRLSNEISRKINAITDAIFNSDLPALPRLRQKVVEEYAPDSLLDLVGLKNILSRVPDNYLSAIVATKLATGFVYSYGLDSNEIDFYNYLQTFIE
ncbi:NAD-glutamate dehydrogenase domain-containing protein [Desulforhopalus singaporensis]|uniref:Glutamate dehydrogenase n=1 Tax=Desulforhopalus singaporensis TaxID=91360 RepID=A0A1H0SC53_9BACT|nr:NAD-glutamate dehydrogenase domain-containing protein [Desulforhopalus singaporensis]SDP39343.1 glutamate dehydrogenase [Desulforhopalus singaporensis]